MLPGDCDQEFCDCGCHHDPPLLHHMIACCQPCKKCKQRIRNGYIKTHEESCVAENQEPAPPEVEDDFR